MNETKLIGKPVHSLQTMLRTIGKLDPAIPTVVPDGIYGPATQSAVAAFQRQQGLPCTGIADYATWQAIVRAWRCARCELSPAAPLVLSMPAGFALTEGSRAPAVLLIQAMLHHLHGVYTNLPDCSLSGVCDGETVQAIKTLQHCCGRPESGILTKELWEMLAALYSQATTEAAAC